MPASSAAQHEMPTTVGEPRQPSAANVPYVGYNSGRRTGVKPMASNNATGIAAGTTATAVEQRRGNVVLATATGVVAIAVLGLLAFLFLNRGSSGAPTAQNSSSMVVAQPSQPTGGAPAPSTNVTTTTQAAPGVTSQPSTSPQAVAGQPDATSSPTTATTPTTASPLQAAQAKAEWSKTSGNYTAVRAGNHFSIFDSTNGQSISSFTVLGDFSDTDFKQLPNCTHPTIVHNTSKAKGSALFGWDGTGYQAYVPRSGDSSGVLYPEGGDGGSVNKYGVNASDQGVEIRATSKESRGSGQQYDGCIGGTGGSDALHPVG